MVALFRLPEGPPTNYFALQRKLFRNMGISFSGNESLAYGIFSKVFITCAICAYPLVQLSDGFKFLDNLSILSVILLYSAITLTGALKFVLIYFSRRAMGKTLDTFEQGVFAPNVKLGGPVEVDLLRKCVLSMNRQSIFFMASVYTTISTGVADAIARRIRSSDHHDWRFPQGHFSVFNVTYSPNFEIALVYQVASVNISCTASMCADVLILGFLMHISTQYKLLQNRTRRMVQNAYHLMLEDNSLEVGNRSSKMDPSQIPWKYLKVVLKENVFYHTEIMALSEIFETQFNYISLLEFMTSSVALCFSLYHSLLFPVNDLQFVHFVLVFFNLSLQVLLICYWGNAVTLESQAVADACSEVNFIGTDIRFQKGLLLMVQRSQRPIVLTAGKFTSLSLNTFVAVMRASYSYYTVMSSR